MASIITRPEINLQINRPKGWFINYELYTASDIFNQQLLEYLARKLFNLPSSKSFLVKATDEEINNSNAPIFYNQEDEAYVFITKLIHEKDSIDLASVHYPYEEAELNYKINNINKLCDSKESCSNLIEKMISLTLLDFFTSQYGRGFFRDIYISKKNGMNISAIYNFGNSYNFNETTKEKETCDSVFGKLSIDGLDELLSYSKYRKFYLITLTSLLFPDVLENFYYSSYTKINSEQKKSYMYHAKEKQNALRRILK